MSERQRGTPAYSPRDDARRSPRLSGVTVPRELLEQVQRLAGDERGALSAAVREALEAWVERRESER